MARTTTSRIGLSKPTPGTGEPVNASIDVGTNWDKVDAAVGAFECTEGTKPATPYAGQIIRTTDTRRMYVRNVTNSAWDQIMLAAGNVLASSTTADVYAQVVSGDTNSRFKWRGDGRLEWGPGNAAPDTNLYRTAANKLRTDDDFEVGGVAQIGAVGVRDAVLSIPNNTATDLTLNVQDFDNASMFAPTSAIMTIPAGADGLYRISLWVLWAAGSTGFRRAAISKNNGTTAGTDSWHDIRGAVSGGDTANTITIDLPLVAGNTIRSKVWHSQGAAHDVAEARLSVIRLVGV